MFNNFAKFELPAVRGSDLWPSTMQAPTMVRASLNYAPIGDDSPHLSEMLTKHFHDVVDDHTPEILNFLVTQRRNYQLGTVDFSSTHRAVGPLMLHYTNMQGNFEVLQIEGTVSEEKMLELMKPPVHEDEPVEPEYAQPVEEETPEFPVLDEEHVFVVVFHEGNKVSWAPMSNVAATSGTGGRRTLKQSNWGTELIKTCQLEMSRLYGVVFSALKGTRAGSITFSRGDKFELTTTLLRDSVIVESDAVHDYPIMAVKQTQTARGARYYVHVDAADWEINGAGKTRALTAVEGLSSDIASYKYRAFAISEDGERYYATSFDSMNQFTGIAYSDQNTEADFNSGPDFPNARYIGFGADISTGLPAFLDGGPITPVGYYNGARKAWDCKGLYFADLRAGDVPHWALFEWKVTAGTLAYTAATAAGGVTVKTDTVSYLGTEDWFPEDGRHVQITGQFGAYEFSHSTVFGYEVGAIWTFRIWDGQQILFPFGRTQWLGLLTTDVSRPASGGAYTGALVSSILVTDYGTLEGGFKVDSDESYTIRYSWDFQAYRGWLHIANRNQLLHAFEWDGQRYMYLNGKKITRLIGVPIEDIQTVMFDVSMEAIARFK